MGIEDLPIFTEVPSLQDTADVVELAEVAYITKEGSRLEAYLAGPFLKFIFGRLEIPGRDAEIMSIPHQRFGMGAGKGVCLTSYPAIRCDSISAIRSYETIKQYEPGAFKIRTAQPNERDY